MIEATYIINNYIKTLISDIDTVTFRPGRVAPENEPGNYILYVVNPNTDHNLWQLHMDIISYRIINRDFDKLQRITARIIQYMNVEDIENAHIARATDDPQITFQQSFAQSTG